MLTKIIATLGPASDSYEVIENMMEQGMDGCRFNFSHGTHKEHLQKIEIVKQIRKDSGIPLSLIGDLQGPKIRIGIVENDAVDIKRGDRLSITTTDIIGTPKRVSIGYERFPADVEAGELLLVDDGKILLEVVETDKKSEVVTKIIQGGELKSRKGVNLPNTKVSIPCLTEKDIKDLTFAIQQDFDWIALSFVRNASDVTELRKAISEINPDSQIKILSKIEKPEAVDQIDAIIEESDALIIARGDLGLELPIQKVPAIQKQIIKKCLQASCPVIVATQMMESMITNITPTRAEVSDVANSVLDGVDALLLSGETSVGNHPDLVVKTVQKIIDEMEVEIDIFYRHVYPNDKNYNRFITDSTLFNAAEMAQQTGAKAISTMTNTGYSAIKLSSQRPKANICVFTKNLKLPSILNILWGVNVSIFDAPKNTDASIKLINEQMKEKSLIHPGEIVINLASVPVDQMGNINMMKLSRVK